jgi:hypothetical protein
MPAPVPRAKKREAIRLRVELNLSTPKIAKQGDCPGVDTNFLHWLIQIWSQFHVDLIVYLVCISLTFLICATCAISAKDAVDRYFGAGEIRVSWQDNISLHTAYSPAYFSEMRNIVTVLKYVPISSYRQNIENFVSFLNSLQIFGANISRWSRNCGFRPNEGARSLSPVWHVSNRTYGLVGIDEFRICHRKDAFGGGISRIFPSWENNPYELSILASPLLNRIKWLSNEARNYDSSLNISQSYPTKVDAYYSKDKNYTSYSSVYPGTSSGRPRPLSYFTVMLGCLCFGGFALGCIGMEGSGHPIYFFGGWIITVAAGGVLVWWWV